jgi:uncharacterized protein (DUF427 family)
MASERKLHNKTNHEITCESSGLSAYYVIDSADEGSYEICYFDGEELESYNINDFIGGQILEVPELSMWTEIDDGTKLRFTIKNVRMKVIDASYDPSWEEVKGDDGFYASSFPTVTEME